MEYDFRAIEKKWRRIWDEKDTYHVEDDFSKEKYYVLDMFPYPSGAGLHVGHPLGYIASDVVARYKKHLGFNVLHPMGYDSFGLPAEQYAIETGQHPEITTLNNIETYRVQLDKLGFSYDWKREVRTSDSNYYKWTQWIFIQIFNSWYNKDTKKAEPIETLIAKFENNGTYNVNAAEETDWWKSLDRSKFPFFGEYFAGEFTAVDWTSMTEDQKAIILMNYRLAFLSESMVNWCPELGTVLANDEIKDGVSERGGHPVVQKKMWQWSMRITAYAERLLTGLETIDWSDSLKEIQKNWIGKSKGASVSFQIEGHSDKIEVFTTRPDTIYGVSFVVLAPELELVQKITTKEYKKGVDKYIENTGLKTDRDRQSNVKEVTGEFTGGYAIHPFTGKKLPIWIADYVLMGYGTGAVMAVPAGDQRDWNFAREFNIPIPEIFEDVDLAEAACEDKNAVLKNSEDLNGLFGRKAISKIIGDIIDKGIGFGTVNYRLRDAIFSRQRYWGEPIPIYYVGDIPKEMSVSDLPLELPKVDKYLPTEDGEPPLARAKKEDWKWSAGDRMEYNTMPGWAGSSWYFLRYMDPNNEKAFCDPEKSDYWGPVDFYMGGAEHATGHLLYSRFWTKFLFDREFIHFEEPFTKLINQGMILGRSSFIYRVLGKEEFVTFEERENYKTQKLHVDINCVDGDDTLDIEKFKVRYPQYASFKLRLNEEGKYRCGHEVEKMSKSKYNVQTPDELVEKYGADTLRCYEMFLGPVEQAKPWDVQGISGTHNFLRKAWRLFNADKRTHTEPTREEMKSLHKTIKKVTEDLNRYSWNTIVSAMMICINELTDLKCTNQKILNDLAILFSPYAPHLAEEMWLALGNKNSITKAPWPKFDESYLKETEKEYPIQFNGKVKFTLKLETTLGKEEIEKRVMAEEKTQQYTNGKMVKKVIVVPGKIVNIVI